MTAPTALNGHAPAAAACPLCDAPGRLDPATGLFRVDPGSISTGSSVPSRQASALPLPFPADVLPPQLQAFCEEGAAAGDLPVDFIAVPTLAYLGGALGAQASLRLKAGWDEWGALWTAVVGDTGSGKSPGIDRARDPVAKLQAAEYAAYRRALDAWQESGEKGAKPTLRHYFTTDATPEAVASIMAENDGLVFDQEELLGWVLGFDRYHKAGDRQRWLSTWSFAPFKVDRRGGEPIFVPHPVVGVVGGIQPDLLPELAGDLARRDGFADRLLIAWPVARVPAWTETSLSPATAQAAERLFATLRPVGGREGVESAAVELSPEARAVWVEWHAANAAAQAAAPAAWRGFLAKGPRHVARLALVLHAGWQAGCCDPPRLPLDLAAPLEEEAMLGAVRLWDYFCDHRARVLLKVGAGAGPRPGPPALEAKVLDALRTAGEAGLSREALLRELGGHLPAAKLTLALQALADRGEAWGERQPAGPKGGRPAEVWRAEDRRVETEGTEKTPSPGMEGGP